ncbi:hypothetical protein [Malaciobacter mytili]|uniref:hypothetical protein n=1 Tax=Malaciobacter mytili TaxID=603050 RepID=UPI003A8681B3
MLTWLFDTFNNRELSTILLVVMFFCYAIYKTEDIEGLISQLFDLLLQFFQKKFLVIQGYFLVYIFIEILILHNFFYWNTTYLKDTMIWMFPAYFLIMNHSALVEKNIFYELY